MCVLLQKLGTVNGVFCAEVVCLSHPTFVLFTVDLKRLLHSLLVRDTQFLLVFDEGAEVVQLGVKQLFQLVELFLYARSVLVDRFTVWHVIPVRHKTLPIFPSSGCWWVSCTCVLFPLVNKLIIYIMLLVPMFLTLQ